MSEWWKYEPADFLLFSARVYYRLVEAHNEALWPAHVLALALGLILLLVTLRAPVLAGQITGVLLGVLWGWVAWSFLWERYATINWAMTYVALAFAAQGLAVIAVGLTRDRLTPVVAGKARWTGFALLSAVIVLYPLIAPALGRPWAAAEVFGIMPDPTAAATLAFLALVRGGAGLMIVPALWCALSSETLWLLGSPDFFVPGAVALVAIFVRLFIRLAQR